MAILYLSLIVPGEHSISSSSTIILHLLHTIESIELLQWKGRGVIDQSDALAIKKAGGNAGTYSTGYRAGRERKSTRVPHKSAHLPGSQTTVQIQHI